MRRRGPSFLELGLDRKRREAIEKKREISEAQETLSPIPPIEEPEDPLPQGEINIDAIKDRNTGRIYIIEVQGRNTGFSGIQDLQGNEFLKHKASFWKKLRSGRGAVNDLDDQSRAANYRYGYENPEWVEEILDNKVSVERAQIIPSDYKPETIDKSHGWGAFDKLCQNFKYIVIKPYNQAQGVGVERFQTLVPKQRQAARDYAEKIIDQYGNFVAQQFIEPAGAQAAPPDLKGHFAVLRFGVGFRRNRRGEIDILDKRGYWRVSQFHPDDVGKWIRGREIRDSDAVVVNRARGAGSAPMTKKDESLVIPIMYQIIENLAREGRKTDAYKRKLRERYHEKILELEDAIRARNPVRVSYHGDEKIPPKQRYEFLYRLENELARINPEIWKTKLMKSWNSPCYIEQISDETGKLRGKIELQYYTTDAVKEWHEFSVEEPGALRRAIKSFVAAH